MSVTEAQRNDVTGGPGGRETQRRSPTRPVSLSPPPLLPLSHVGSIIGVLLLGFALRLYRLSDANIWWDEGLAVWVARQSPLEIARWTAVDVHPPLYFWMLHVWRQLAGDSEFAVRFLSVAVGTLTVVAVWYLGRLLVPRRPWLAAAAALFVALSRFDVWWSQEARMYMLGGLLATLSLAFTVRLRRRFGCRPIAGYLVTTVAALWTLYLLAFLLVIEGVYWLWTLRTVAIERPATALRSIGRWAGLQIVTLAAVLPWLAYALPRTRSWSVQEAFDPMLYAQLYATLLTLGISTNVEQYRLPMLVVAGILLIGLLAHLFRSRPLAGGVDGISLLFLTLLVPPLVVWMLTMLPRSFGYAPHPEARYLLPFAPPFALLVALSAAGLIDSARDSVRTGVATLLALGLVGAVLLGAAGWSLADYYAGRYRSDDYHSVALTLRAHLHPNDLVVLHTDDPWPIFAYHWPHEFEGTPHLQDADADGADYFLSPLWERHDALWLVVNEDAVRVDPRRYFEGWLADRALAQHEWRFGTKRVMLFAKTPARADRLLALAPGFTPPAPSARIEAAGFRLVGWEQPLQRVRAGDLAHLAAYVERVGVAGRLRVALGNSALAEDTAPVPTGTGITRLPLTVRVPPDTPRGSLGWHVTFESADSTTEMTVGSVDIVPAPATPTGPTAAPAEPLEATFGEPAVIRLLGYDLHQTSSEDSTLHLTLYWETRATPPISYKVFTHLINSEGRVETQRDGIPANGSRPTTSWRTGEIVADTYEIPVSEAWPGTYVLRAGFYDPVTGERLGPVRNEDGIVQPNDEVTITTVTVP